MKRYLLTAAFVTAFAIGGAQAQTQKANPVDGSGNPQGTQTLDPAGTKAQQRDNMLPNKGSTTMQRSGPSSDPVQGSGSAANDRNLDPAGTKAAEKDKMKGTTTGSARPSPMDSNMKGTGAGGSGGSGSGGAGGGGAGGNGR